MRLVLAIVASIVWTGITSAGQVVHDKDHPADFKPDYKDVKDWEKRADFLRRQALVAQGLWPMPEKTELKPTIHGKIDRGDYTIEKVFFASLPGHYVSGNLYRPKSINAGQKVPAVLMPYGHWPNGRFIWNDDASIKKQIDSGAETSTQAARSPLQANCVQLARMGCIVFHYDLVGYADSQKIAHRDGFKDAEAVMRLQSFMGLQTWNSIRSLDFVLRLPEVDEKRVGVAGSSGGGTQSIGLAALDPRVAASFPMVMVSMNMQGGCICENAPLYRVGTNNVELACLFAPKPHGAASANDWTHDFLTRGLPEMKAIWKLYGAEDLVQGMKVEFGHNHNLHSRRAQYAFFNKNFKLALAEPVDEKPFEPVNPKELSVYDQQHPVPADACDAAELRKRMTKASDEQLAKMSDAEFVKTVRAALEAILEADDQSAPGPEEAKPATRSTDDAWFFLGYNPSPISRRARDLLRTWGSKKDNKVDPDGDDALAGFIACAIAGDDLTRSPLDLKGFDFDQVRDLSDPRLLPGALKYGGVKGIERLPQAKRAKSIP
jgi:hypothetical protein